MGIFSFIGNWIAELFFLKWFFSKFEIREKNKKSLGDLIGDNKVSDDVYMKRMKYDNERSETTNKKTDEDQRSKYVWKSESAGMDEL